MPRRFTCLALALSAAFAILTPPNPASAGNSPDGSGWTTAPCATGTIDDVWAEKTRWRFEGTMAFCGTYVPGSALALVAFSPEYPTGDFDQGSFYSLGPADRTPRYFEGRVPNTVHPYLCLMSDYTTKVACAKTSIETVNDHIHVIMEAVATDDPAVAGKPAVYHYRKSHNDPGPNCIDC